MKTLLFCFLVFMSGLLTAQTVDSPVFKARNGSIRNITRIERTSSVLKFIFMPSFVRTGGLWKTVTVIWKMLPRASVTHR